MDEELSASLEEETEFIRAFASGHNQFTAEVYKELRKSNSGNFLVCPLSAETGLVLIHEGAGGQTAQQISAALHLPGNKETIQDTFRILSHRLQSTEYYNLSSANKIYVKEGNTIKDQFKEIAINVFDAEIENIDFQNKQKAGSIINEWVQEKTYDTIKNAINANELDDVAAVLINAMYFRGNWAKPFDKENTTSKPFYLNDKNHVEIDMMEQTDFFGYHESSELNAKFLEMPYAGAYDFISMIVVLPNDKEGLSELEGRIADVFAETSQIDYHDVHVVIPKFKIETTIQFQPILQNLGVVDLFGDKANLVGIVDQPLKISKAIQKAFIEVDEEGTEVSAATVYQAMPISADFELPTPKQFIAAHPFIFYLKIKDVVFFVGRHISVKN